MYKLYDQFASWYRLIDPVEDHRDEAACYQQIFERALEPPLATLLELGAGAGNNARYLKQTFRCTLSDLSAQMLDLSRHLNPECEHLRGDMRTLRLGRSFDAVLVHDAVVYMLNVADLGAVARTAFLHTRPGGAAIFAPDFVREGFAEQSQLIEGSDGQRSLRCVEWIWDPDSTDDTCAADYVYVLREGRDIEVVHERHVEGLFARETWRRVLAAAGFEVSTVARALEDADAGMTYCDEVFLCRRPA